ncbi:hypothetical protein CLU79DRAFT_533364 [Phycomyces nitens]|nr:hypothetical protein CLU79DRAFT_533364 [Phycomyces nitens]
MSDKRKSLKDTSPAQVKKTRINGLSKDNETLLWVESSFKKTPPCLDYFSFAENFNDTEEATNTFFKDLLLTLQSKQSNKVTNIAHAAETTFSTRRNHKTDFGKEYHAYWESRKDSTLEKDINDSSRSTISSI